MTYSMGVMALHRFWYRRGVMVIFQNIKGVDMIIVGGGDWEHSVEFRLNEPIPQQVWQAVFEWVEKMPSMHEDPSIVGVRDEEDS